MVDIEEILSSAPDNFVIKNALQKCYEVLREHNNVMCSISGGADSDVMLDMILRCGGRDKTTFVFFNTGLEYKATLEHLDELEEKYKIHIERVRAVKSIPTSCREYGIPFWGKHASEMIYRLQKHGFKWEDKPFEELIEEYPHCKTALEWWCNKRTGKSNLYFIDRAPFLKEFMIQNPPQFKVSDMCCEYAKKKVSHRFEKGRDFDMGCTGVRKAEGGIRSGTFTDCFSSGENGRTDMFRPIFWFEDSDKDEYCKHYGIVHSRCYTEYGLKRTGCVGCPFGKNFEQELEILHKHEPQLGIAAENVFGISYEYTRQYLEFRDKMKQQKKRPLKASCAGLSRRTINPETKSAYQGNGRE